jgi:RNA polymerase sigma-70 factor (ECF subfamily)
MMHAFSSHVADGQSPACYLLTSLYQCQRGALIAHVSRLVGSRELAEDLCQETFLRALQHWPSDAPPVEARAWLYRVATNLAYDELRRHQRRGAQNLPEERLVCDAAQSDLCQVEDRDLVHYLLKSLPTDTATLVMEYFGNQRSLRELAQHFGCPEGTIKSRTSRARTHLRTIQEPVW